MFYRTGGEFPTIKVIGYRELYMRRTRLKQYAPTFNTIIRSKKTVSDYQLLPKTSRYAAAGSKFRTFSRKSPHTTKLVRKKLILSRRERGASSYNDFSPFPILAGDAEDGERLKFIHDFENFS